MKELLGIFDNILPGYKTKLAAFGLFGYAIYQFSQGNLEGTIQAFLAGLAAIGLGSKIDRAIDSQTPVTPEVKPTEGK